MSALKQTIKAHRIGLQAKYAALPTELLKLQVKIKSYVKGTMAQCAAK